MTSATLLAVPLLLAASYLLGSIPFGLVITRAMGLGDLRKIGSGNIGATNVLRTGNKGAALATLLLDSGKGALAVLLARALGLEQAAAFAGLAAFLGHIYPVWLGFRGGKGVATYLGTLLAVSPLAGVLTCLVWLAMAIAFRFSSLSALVAALLAPVWMLLNGAGAERVGAAALMTALIFWTHRQNIARLRRGEESRISLRRNKTADNVPPNGSGTPPDDGTGT